MALIEKTGDLPRQQFRASTESFTTSIQTQVDPITGSFIVLWRNIQSSFPSIRCLRHKDSDIHCLVDPDTLKDFDPPRIHYYPDVVLEVIQNDSPLSSSRMGDGAISHFSASNTNTPSLDNDGKDNIRPHPWPLQRQSTNHLKVTGLGKSLVHCSKHMKSHGQDYAASFTNLYESYVEAMMAGQDQQIESIKTRMDAAMDSMLVSLVEKLEGSQVQLLEKDRENKEMQKQMFEMQEDMVKRQASMMEKMEKNQAELLEKDRENKKMQENMMAMQESMTTMQKQMLKMQEEALNRLAVIQSRVHAILTQTYELFEYPIPRLFIVLPKEQELWDKLTPFTQKFKVYFLCECGDHTKKISSSNSKMPHHIHLAKHPGYDLLRPTEFFEKYGPYLLTMMEMVKFGIAAAGVVVPALGQLGILDGIEEIKDQLDSTEKAFAPLLDGSISYVKDRIGQDLPDADLEGRNGLKEQEALEGADLRQLASFLDKADEARTLGNLYRTVTEEGHVKWVCFDHYRAGYMESVQQRFADIITTNEGYFFENLGQVGIDLSTPLTAQEFYDALKRTKGVNELIITLQWDATKSDIQQLCDAIFESNVSILTVNGCHFRGPSSDVLNRGSRFDPFIQMISRGKLQSFTIKDCYRFIDRISDIPSPVIPTLRALHLYYGIDERDFKKITNLFRRFPNLVEMTVARSDFDEIPEFLPIQQLPQLSVLNLRCLWFNNRATLQLLNGTIRHVDIQVDCIPKLAYSGFLREFEMVQYIVPLADVEYLLRINMGLTELHMKMPKDPFEYISLIGTLMSTRRSPLLIVMVNRWGCIIKMEFWGAAKVPVPSTESTGKWIQLPQSMVHVQEWHCTKYNFQRISSNIEIIFSGLEEMVHDADEVKLDLDMSLLTEAGIGALQKAMALLRPERCIVIFKEYKQEWAHCYDFNPMCWSRLSWLGVSGEDMMTWLQRPGSVFKREMMPSLQELWVMGQGKESILSGSLANWLASMVSFNEASQSLNSLGFSFAHFSHEDWRTILGSIDYSSLKYLSLDGCDLTGAFPGSYKDQEYNVDDLCRHVGLGTEYQEQAAVLVLDQHWHDGLSFKRK